MAGVKEIKDDGGQKQKQKYVYLLITFNKRGPKTGKQDHDFVPASWVYVSKKTGKLVVKFMPPPYLEETSHLLHHLIKSLSDPVADWPEYNVQIKGGAASYEEAENRIAELDAKEYAFTTDADETPEAKASNILRQLKQTKLKVSAETEAALQVSDLTSDQEEDSSTKEVLVPQQRRHSSKPRGSRSTLLDINDTSAVSKSTSRSTKVIGHDANLKKKKTIGKVRNQNENPEKQDCKQKKRDPDNGFTINSINSKASTSQRYANNLVDENSNMSEGSLPESVRESYSSRYKLTVNNVFTDTDSGDEGHIDENRNVKTSRDKSHQLLTGYHCHGNNSIEKPSEPMSEKLGQRNSKSCIVKKSKSSRPKDQPNSQQDDHKSNPMKTNSKSNFSSSNKKGNKSRKPKSRDEFTSDSELLWQIYEDIQGMKVNIEEIRANQRKEEEIRHESKVENGIQEDFILKYNLDLPHATKESFDEFNADLLSDEDLRKDFMKSLVKFFDKDLIASKTVCNILKKYLTRKLALKYTAIKRMPGKFLMKETAFFDCLLGVLADTHRDKGGKFISESTFSSVLGTVLGNAKDWDGKQNRKNMESDSDGASRDQASGVDG